MPFAPFILWFMMLPVLIGCAAPVKHDTASGKPEVTIENTDSESVKQAVVNKMLDLGYTITSDTPYQISFDLPVESVMISLLAGSSYDAQPNARMAFTIAQTRAGVRVIADVALITNPGSAFERRTVLNQHRASIQVQTMLEQLKADVEQSRASSP
jgi:hypothetical protein